jgi:hypothetical protein
VDGNKQSISSAKDHQKVDPPVIYQTGTPLVSIKEPVFLTSKRSKTLWFLFFFFFIGESFISTNHVQ